MAAKMDESTPGIKTLRIFRKLLLNGGKHFQSSLASEFNCSPQTIIRIMGEIESVIGISLEMGRDQRRKWYRIKSRTPASLGLEFEELRYLSVCRDLASQTLPKQILSRVDDTIFNLSMKMAERKSSPNDLQVLFYSKGKIDYTPFFPVIEKLFAGMEQKRVCAIAYRAAGRKTPREYKFAPNCMVTMNQALYALGAALDKDGGLRFINLAVHRIKRCALTAERFDIDFPDAAVNTFGLPWHEPRQFKVHIQPGKAADYVSERVWSDIQEMEWQPDGSILLTLTTCSEPELQAWVRSFGDQARLLE